MRPEEPRREEAAAPNEVNYSFGARVKPNAAHQMRASSYADSEVSSSRTSSRPMEPSSSASTAKANYSFGARLSRGVGPSPEPKLVAVRNTPAASETASAGRGSIGASPRESYFFGARTQSRSRSGSLVGV